MANDIKSHSTLPTSLVSYWDLEEASGTRYDLVGSNDLTDNATVTQATGQVGNCGQFTAANSESLENASPTGLQTGNGDRSISCWIKWDSLWTSQDRFIVDYGAEAADDEFNLAFYHDGSNYYYYMDRYGAATQSDGTLSLSTDTWYHFVVTYDGTSLRWYKDGTLDETKSIGATLTTANDDINIGRRGAGTLNSRHHDGQIDEVGFWNKELTSDEVSDLYNSGSGIPYWDPDDIKNDTDLTTSLVSFYEFNDDATDSHTNANNGTGTASPTYEAAKNDNGIVLNGSTQDVVVNDDATLDITGDISLSCWFNPDQLASALNNQRFMNKGNLGGDGNGGYRFTYYNASSDNRLLCQIWDSSNADEQWYASNIDTTDVWYHVVYALDVSASECKIYINGVQQAVTDIGGAATSIGANSGEVTIGSYESASGWMDGTLDDFAIYSKQLTEAEVRALYGYGTPPVYEAAAAAATPVPNLNLLGVG